MGAKRAPFGFTSYDWPHQMTFSEPETDRQSEYLDRLTKEFDRPDQVKAIIIDKWGLKGFEDKKGTASLLIDFLNTPGPHIAAMRMAYEEKVNGQGRMF